MRFLKTTTLTLCFILSFGANVVFGAGVGSVTKANMLIQALEKKDFKIVGALIKEEPELLYTPNDTGITPLALAVKNDDVFLFKYLIESGAPVSSPYYDKPLLVLALYSDSKKTMVSLLELGADAQQTYHGLSPLHIAVLLNRMDYLGILLQYGVDPDQMDNKGLTPFHMAALKHYWDFVRALSQVTKDMNTTDADGLTPLLYFIEKAPRDLADFLDATKENLPSLLDFQSKKVPPALIDCIKRDEISALELLLQNGANVNIQDMVSKNTPLITAVLNDNIRAVKVLLDYNPNFNLKNKKRKKALDLSEPESDIRFLLEDKIYQMTP